MELKGNKKTSLLIRENPKKGISLTSTGKVAEILHKLHRHNFDEIDREKECFLVLHLNSNNQISLLEVVSIGTLTSSLVHPRETFRRAIANGTAKIILAHNHPSGQIEPSQDDLLITKRLSKAGDLLGIQIIDHIIFNHIDEEYFSFVENRLSIPRKYRLSIPK